MSSCTNHIIQLRGYLGLFASQEDRFPPITNTRQAFEAIATKCGQVDLKWFSSYWASCPEAHESDGSIGHVFVAGGASTEVVSADKSMLVLFCPAESHRRSGRCHVVMGWGDLNRIESNAEMIELLRNEIRRGKEGEAPYASSALQVMERELTLREGFEKD